MKRRLTVPFITTEVVRLGVYCKTACSEGVHPQFGFAIRGQSASGSNGRGKHGNGSLVHYEFFILQ